MKRLRLLHLLLIFVISSCALHQGHKVVFNNRLPAEKQKTYQRIDVSEVLFGIEYSFQDREIVNEPGRMTFRTEHKYEKFVDLFENYAERLELTESSIVEDTSDGDFKPGYKFFVPGDGEYTINMEPVTIEINTTPKKIHEIIPTSTEIFEAAKQAELVPYVNPAAERSGMGHIHVGGRRLMDSPLYQNPTLLRNLLVYYHKHPSLLYGFAEAFDIGDNSNIETFHGPERQLAFKKAIKEFDTWYLKNQKNRENTSQGLKFFLEVMKEFEPPGYSEFFHHYRVLNLEHLKQLITENILPQETGKFTIEHRAFRPQKDAQTAHANAELLLDLYEKLSDPQHLEPFEDIDPVKFKSFWTATAIEQDWKIVKAAINHDNPYSDAMIKETTDALRKNQEMHIAHIPKAKLYPAFSRKEDKGRAFELKIQSNSGKPIVEVQGKNLVFQSYREGSDIFWVSYIDTIDLNISPRQLMQEGVLDYKGQSLIGSCKELLGNFFRR